jgi:hypothetical protein
VYSLGFERPNQFGGELGSATTLPSDFSLGSNHQLEQLMFSVAEHIGNENRRWPLSNHCGSVPSARASEGMSVS